MILEFSDRNYIDVDKISVLRFFPSEDENSDGNGIAVIDGAKIVLNKENFDVIEQAYIYSNKSFMYNDKNKKIVWKRGES